MVLVAIVVLGAIAGAQDRDRSADTSAGSAHEPAAPEAPAAAKKPAGPARTMADGVYQVGVDVQGGRYKTPGPPADSVTEMCYWSRNKNDSGEFEAVIANGVLQGPGSVSLKRGEFIELSGGCAWSKVG